MLNVCVFISGSGSNLQAIIDAKAKGKLNHINLLKVIADRECQGINRAITHGIEHGIVSHRLGDFQSQLLESIPDDCDLIVLAGFLSILGSNIIEEYEGRILNIHPALLPKYGGKGMYGMKVHEAVIASDDHESGCTVHFVDNGIDTGQILAQIQVPILPLDSAKDLAKRVLEAEHELLVSVLRSFRTSGQD